MLKASKPCLEILHLDVLTQFLGNIPIPGEVLDYDNLVD